ncbi:regulator of microtubule dynamics protein 2 isoform X1 [Sceloporus undulatus]|uniref:regulator of microtubule dynamics protein 2 isoform X1 n=1 Tax=Sceloporus undulatus TaxID=8520 RepID=UPI001C4D7673|nr:regulator of microtubule dynamics protein 2 isoform X1 [Sceloporus undulatus]XP_042334083.1 regulator of microtubule dynamics protein 2 isoform X1 [Sceloporus undulatus]
MAHSENKRLIFGLMAGAAGITLVVLWYRKIREPRKAVHLPTFPNSEKSFDLIDFPYDAHNEQGTMMLLQGRQLQILEKLNGLLVNVDELKKEVKILKEAVPKLEELVQNELQGKTDIQRTSPLHRATKKRKVEATQGMTDTTSSEEAESEGGYMTAHTDTEGESEEEKGWINSSTTSLTPEEKIDLFNLLQESDRLHSGSDNDKRESFKLLLENEEKYRNCAGFLWRLARAYGDMFMLTTDAEEKKNYASEGKLVAENAISLDSSVAESHQWFAMMCGYMSQFESIQNKIKNGYLFKEHLDKAKELKPQDPFLYYLTGRWCYEVAQLSWIEKKVAAALFGTPPTSTIHEALQNFLKAEEIHPGYSKYNYVYIAKCYKDLGQRSNALKSCETALSILSVTKEDEEAEKDLETLLPSLKL